MLSMDGWQLPRFTIQLLLLLLLLLLCLTTSIRNPYFIAVEAQKRRVMGFFKFEYALSVNISRTSAVV